MKPVKSIIPPDFGVNPFFCVDINGNIIAVNNNAEKTVSISKDELCGKTFSSLFTDPLKADEILCRVLTDGSADNFLLSFCLGDEKNLTDIKFNAFCDMDKTNETKKVYVIANVIARQIEQQEENFQKAVKEISDYKYALDESSIVAITDQKGVIKHVNENFCKISKYSKQELIGQDHRIINSGYHSKEFIRDLWTTIANGKIWKGELKNKAKDGSYYWVDTTIVPFLNEQGKPYQYIAIREDITERKKIEEKQLLYQLIIHSSDDAIISKNLNGVITSWNRGAENIFGYTSVEAIGKNVSILIPPGRFDEEIFIMGKIKRGEYVDHYETERIRKDGGHIYISLTVSPIQDANGNIVGASKIARDITERKKIQEEFKRLNEELELRVKERTEEMESFSYSVSHDLRAPLRAVSGYAQILEEDYENIFDVEGKRLLGEIQYNAKRMGILIDDLLAFSRLGRKEVVKSFINMNLLVEAAIKEINQSTTHHAEIKFNGLVSAKADYALLEHVLINLISNAVKYSAKKERPLIEIKSKKENGELIYSISDNGVGFDMQYANKLFGVFQRLHSSDEFPGTGVGLAIVQRIIYKHKGRIWAEGELDKGATFYFSLPED